MAQTGRSILLAIPEGYTPRPFTPVQVRSLLELRSDHSTDPEQWVTDMIDTVTEMYMPAEELYQQEENLRILQYEIDHAADDPERQEFLIRGQEDLLDKYAKERVEAEERIDEALLEETRRRYLDNLHIIVKDSFVPEEDIDVLEDAISEEMLIKGYQPAPFKPKELRSVEEQREIFETVPEGGNQPEAVDENQWALEMQEIIADEVMPPALLHSQEESLRKLQYQIDRLNANEDVEEMVEPYEIIEPDENMLSPEDYDRAVRDQLYKEDLNRRFAKRVQLEKERDELLDIYSEDRAVWQDELDQRMEKELELRQENLIKHGEFLREQQELAEEEAERLREETERQIKRAEEAKLIAKEERRRREEENQRAIEEEKRKAAEEEAERQRRIEEYEKNLKAEEDAKANRIFAERVLRRMEELRREEEEAQYRAERLARQKKYIVTDALNDEQPEEEKDAIRAAERPEKEAGGIGLDELLQEQPTGAVSMRREDIDLTGAQSGTAGDFFEQREEPEGTVFTGNDDIDLTGAQSGAVGDFFEEEPKKEEEPEEIKDNEPVLDDLLGDMPGNDLPPEPITLPKVGVASAYRPTEAELKERFVEAISRQNFTYAGDQELLADLFDARLVRNQNNPNVVQPDKDLSAILEDIQKKRRTLNDPVNRRQTLQDIKESLDRIPEERRGDAHKKASQRIQKEIDRIPFLEEADRFGKELLDRGWFGQQGQFRDLYIAGEGLNREHPYQKLLEDMRNGKSQSHPEFPARRVKKSRYFTGEMIINLQTYDDLGKAKELLEKEGINTPARERAIGVITDMQHATKNLAKSEREMLDEAKGWISLTKEQRTRLAALDKKLTKDPEALKHEYYTVISTALKGLSKDLSETDGFYRLKENAYHLRQIESKMPRYIQDLSMNHSLFTGLVDALGFINPEMAEQVSKQAFETEMANMKVLKDNFAAVSKSYLGHKNSPQYQNMMNALDEALKSKTPQELIEKKKDLALMTTRYLDHTGLKSASIFHKNAETRRKLAFLTLYRCNSPERPWFEGYQTSANQVRKESDKIYVERLLSAPGIGRPLTTQVKEIDAAALADKVGVNRLAKETHRRKASPTATNIIDKDKEIEGPTFNKHHN